MAETYPGHRAVGRSTAKLIGLCACAAAATALGIWLLLGGAVEKHGDNSVLVGWIAAVLFGLCWLVLSHRLHFGDRQPLEVTPQGFLDKRLFKHPLPWGAVLRLSAWSHRGTSMLRLQVTDEAMRQAGLTWLGRGANWINRSFGLDGIYIGSADLDISFAELRKLFQDHLSAYNPSAKDETR